MFLRPGCIRYSRKVNFFFLIRINYNFKVTNFARANQQIRLLSCMTCSLVPSPPPQLSSLAVRITLLTVMIAAVDEATCPALLHSCLRFPGDFPTELKPAHPPLKVGKVLPEKQWIFLPWPNVGLTQARPNDSADVRSRWQRKQIHLEIPVAKCARSPRSIVECFYNSRISGKDVPAFFRRFKTAIAMRHVTKYCNVIGLYQDQNLTMPFWGWMAGHGTIYIYCKRRKRKA